MVTKAEKIQKAVSDIKHQELVIYHVISPIDKKTFAEIENRGYFEQSKGALGGQSDGYYFFTTNKGVNNHIETQKDVWEYSDDKDAYVVECKIDARSIKYPDWKLDYEATQDFFFDMIYEAASEKKIKFDSIEINAVDGKKLEISYNGKFSRIKNFCANDHSGLIEKTADFLYKHDENFKRSYDALLQDVFLGIGENQELYAVKTTTKPDIIKITKIEKETVKEQARSQIDKFLSRYSRNRR